MSAMDNFTEAVALAQREVVVAETLVREHQNKLRLAEDEANESRDRLSKAKVALADAAVKAHEAVYGRPVSFDDRMEFEKRWDARVEENNRRLEVIRKMDEEYAAECKALREAAEAAEAESLPSLK